MQLKKIWLLSLMVAAGMLLLAGCSSEDNPTDPANSSNIITLQAQEAEDFTTSALDMVGGLVDDIPEFASGDFDQYNMANRESGKAQSDSVQWDAGEQAYTFLYDGPVFALEPPNYWNMHLAIWVQYRDAGGTPLQYPVGAVEMEVEYTHGMAMHMEDAESSADMSYDMTTNLVVSYLGGGDQYGLAGSGHTQVQVASETPGGSESGSFDMDWSLDLVTTAAGCPEGTVEVTAQGYTLEATYDGAGGVSWVMNGPGYSSSGIGYAECGAAEAF
jgi:hypothetical protein